MPDTSCANLTAKNKKPASLQKRVFCNYLIPEVRRLHAIGFFGTVRQLFLDAGGLAGTVAQVIQLGTAHIAAALQFDTGDLWRISLESPFHAFTGGNLATVSAADLKAKLSMKNASI